MVVAIKALAASTTDAAVLEVVLVVVLTAEVIGLSVVSSS